MSNAISLYNEGFNYYHGSNGYPLDYDKAYYCFKDSADLGLSEAMNCLGIFYENGIVVSCNYEKAIEWYLKAINKDPQNVLAIYNLGCMVYSGRGTSQNIAQAYELFKSCVDSNSNQREKVYAESCYYIGSILSENYRNYKESYSYFLEAANNGDFAVAWYNLGWLTEKRYGENFSSNSEKDNQAMQYYKKAANKGDTDAMDAVGRLYASYNMLDEARPWLEKAASMGNEQAKKRLRLLKFA